MTGRAEEVPSQSLSSRAMSFDIKVGTTSETTNVSIPFEQGDVFRRLQMRQVRWQYLVSIPFEQGDVFRHERAVEVHTGYQSQSLSSRAMSFDKPVDAIVKNDECLNPFRAGRCLSTQTRRS